MQNRDIRLPSKLDTWSKAPPPPWGSGNVMYQAFDTASLHNKLGSNGYTGSRPRPLVPHNFDLLSFRQTCQNEAKQVWADRSTSWQSGDILSRSLSTFELLPATSHQHLYNDALEKLNVDRKGSLNLAVDLAQAGSTVKMLKVTDELKSYAESFVRRFGVIKVGSKAWLTFTYGIKPLVSSIFGAADESLRLVINRLMRFRARASDTYTPTGIRVPTLWGVLEYPIQTAAIKRSVTIGVHVRTAGFDLQRWTSMNPLVIAWELLPFSFVADWVFNVGQYLNNMEAGLHGANEFVSGYRTQLQVGDVAFQWVDEAVPPGAVSQHSFHRGANWHCGISRQVLGKYPMPTPPSFSVDMGSSRMLSAAALLGVLLK